MKKHVKASIIDLILKDHMVLKDCINTLKDEDAGKPEKLEKARIFLDALQTHAEAEEIALYKNLKNKEDLHLRILEGYEEHAIATKKLIELRPKIKKAKILSDELEAKMKVLAELVEHHVQEEESELFPEIQEKIDEETLKKYGSTYVRERGFSEEEITDHPLLIDAIEGWRNTVTTMSSKFTTKVDKYIDSHKQ